MRKVLVLFLCFIIILSGCSKEEGKNKAEGATVYYLNSTFSALSPESINIKPEELTVEDCIDFISEASAGNGIIAPLEGIPVLETNLSDGLLSIDFGREYQTLTDTRELLVRAAVVKTLVQCEDVNQVEFFVGGDPLKDMNDNNIGVMDKDKFVEYFGKEQDAVLSENLTIYYVSEDGLELIKETHRVYFENTLSLEQAVIKCMMEMPESAGSKCAIAPNTNIINITTTDGTCYLDLDMSFYDANSEISPSVSVAAIVNSLCELNNIRQVQVSIIDNQSESSDTMIDSLSGTYEKNMDIVRQ